MRRHLLTVLILWIVLTIIGEVVALQVNFNPVAASEEARHIDGAIRQLIVMAVPVFMFVLAVLGYSLLRFRTSDGLHEEGPPIHGSKAFSVGWLVITASLAVAVFYTPGLTGLRYLRANTNQDLVVKVEAAQWHWHVSYPQYDLAIKSSPTGFESMGNNAVLALPVNQHIKFEVTSADVIHSFWIPAFRMKVDAVPGSVTSLYVTPDRTGDFEQDFNYRVQCAELCGTGHARMNMRVAVMEPAEFENWIAAQKQAQMTGGMQMDNGGGAQEEHAHSEDQ
jgi:cytochrome c oxidase subunit 2